MMKGYLTTFLSLSLSIFIAFLVFLMDYAIRNGGKVRFETVVDIGMNSVLAEFHTGLHERYDLLYVDASYLGEEPSVSNVEGRLAFYINENIRNFHEGGIWGTFYLESANITSYCSAASGKGNSMKYQAVQFVLDRGIEREEAEIMGYLPEIRNLDNQDVLGEWEALQAEIAGMELPIILNGKGEWEEVPLNNPADGVFGLSQSDVLFLAGVNCNQIGVGHISQENYISGRKLQNEILVKEKDADDQLFLTYLFEKMGNFGRVREGALLQYQLEYIAVGETSDYENLQAVVERLLRWRMAVNVNAVFHNGALCEEALAAAQELPAVCLKEEFREPVADSILYACAYLESIADVRCLMSGGRLNLSKEEWITGIEQVKEVSYEKNSSSRKTGLTYEQYLACLIMLLNEDVRNLRSMDIMEMDIRKLYGNSGFCMDYCIERFCAKVQASFNSGDSYYLERSYGYY